MNKGFTLIELMVAISIFSMVMIMTMGSVLSVLSANNKSQSLRAVMDNVNSTMESMTRTIRFGQNYHCGASGDPSLPQDCTNGDSTMSVLDSTGDIVTFQLTAGVITRTIGGTTIAITSPDVTIDKLAFYVFGSQPYSSLSGDSCPPSGTNDCLQPQAIMVVGGHDTLAKASEQTSFTLETTVSQRVFDFQ